jgi:hypothetical protein
VAWSHVVKYACGGQWCTVRALRASVRQRRRSACEPWPGTDGQRLAAHGLPLRDGQATDHTSWHITVSGKQSAVRQAALRRQRR